MRPRVGYWVAFQLWVTRRGLLCVPSRCAHHRAMRGTLVSLPIMQCRPLMRPRVFESRLRVLRAGQLAACHSFWDAWARRAKLMALTGLLALCGDAWLSRVFSVRQCFC